MSRHLFPTGIPAEYLRENYELNAKSFEHICSICRSVKIYNSFNNAEISKLTPTIGAHRRKKKAASRLSISSVSREAPQLCKNRICENCYQNLRGSTKCGVNDCDFAFSKKLIIMKNDLSSLVFKCPEKICDENFLYDDFLTHTHENTEKEESSSENENFAEGTAKLENSVSEVLRKIADELETKESEELALKDQEIENLKSLLNLKDEKIDELEADADEHNAYFLNYTSEMELEKEIVKEELDAVIEKLKNVKDENYQLVAEKNDYLQMILEFENIKEELVKVKEENSQLLTIKEDFLQMSKMFGRFNIEWMESKGSFNLSFFIISCFYRTFSGMQDLPRDLRYERALSSNSQLRPCVRRKLHKKIADRQSTLPSLQQKGGAW